MQALNLAYRQLLCTVSQPPWCVRVRVVCCAAKTQICWPSLAMHGLTRSGGLALCCVVLGVVL